MSRFGGPGNNYSLHGIAALVDCLRRTDDGIGFVSANGGYLTKHAVGVYGRRPGREAWRPQDGADLQARLDELERPRLVEEGDGALTIVGHTVRYSRGEPAEAIVLGTLGDGRRCVAVASDDALIRTFIDDDCVGRSGTVVHRDGRNHFSFA
jgi:acetyl-CoA C-acetyltransferase